MSAKTIASALVEAGESSASGAHFPTYSDLHQLPPSVRAAVMELILNYFRARIYPRLVFLAARKRRRNNAARMLHTVPPLTPALLSSVFLFSRWAALDALAYSATLAVFEAGEIVVHQGDTSRSGVLFLVSGTTQARVRHPNAGSKAINDTTTRRMATFEAPQVHDEYVFLDDSPRQHSVVCLTRCAFWVIDRVGFEAALAAQSAERRAVVAEQTAAHRKAELLQHYPVTGALLKRTHLFPHVPVEMLDTLAPRLIPRVVKAGVTICRIGDVARECYLIARGRVSVAVASVDGAHDGVHDEERGDATESLSYAGPGDIVGDVAVLFNQRRACTLVALQPTDVYAMNREAVTQAVPIQDLMSGVLSRSHAQQARRQQHARGTLYPLVQATPLLGDVGTPELHQAVLEAAESCVYPVHGTMTSVSQTCDRLILLVRGRARITTTKVELAVGEAVGYTCLVPHRWQYHVMAIDTVETLELGHATFARLCKAHGVHSDMVRLSRGLMFPRALPEAFRAAAPIVRHCRNPPFYPVSTDSEAKPVGARASSRPRTLRPLRGSPPRALEGGVFLLSSGAPAPRPEVRASRPRLLSLGLSPSDSEESTEDDGDGFDTVVITTRTVAVQTSRSYLMSHSNNASLVSRPPSTIQLV